MTREEAIRELKADYCGNRIICELYPDQCNREDCEIWLAIKALAEQPIRVPETQPEVAKGTNVPINDTISRQSAIDEFLTELTKRERKNLLHTWSTVEVKYFVAEMLERLPSAQPERTCVNCGRTVNNGGWYADGGTRCPIEEHYALPKDGYCHLWEKRSVTDDDYPERRTDGRD